MPGFFSNQARYAIILKHYLRCILQAIYNFYFADNLGEYLAAKFQYWCDGFIRMIDRTF